MSGAAHTRRPRDAAEYRGGRGLREGDLRARAPGRGPGRDLGACRAARRLARDGDRDAEAARRARPGRARALPRRRAHRRPGERVALEVIRHHRLIEAYPRRGAGDALGPCPRRGRGARALHLGGARGADRGNARRPQPRPARRPDPRPRARARAEDDTIALDGASSRAAPAIFAASRTPTRRCCATSTSAGSGRACALRLSARDPFEGPLFVEVDGDRARARAAELAAAMRVSRQGAIVNRASTRRPVDLAARRPRACADVPADDEDVALPGEAAVAARRAPLARRALAWHRAPLALPRPGVHRRRRLHRPGQLRHQHRRRSQVRLSAALGGGRGEPDRDADPDAVGEARDRDRQEPAGALPRDLLHGARRSASGCRPRSSRWPATSPRSSARRSASTCCSGSRCSRRR